MANEDQKGVRVDKWLWAARFYKTRSLAAEAVNGGHVRINGARVKPSRAVAVGDEMEVHKPPYTFVLVVKGLSGRRGSAAIASKLYEEHADSIAKREQVRVQSRQQAALNPRPRGRPDKRERRRLMQMRDKN
jgi:ribosome-associated heat shock protein Hsp15